MSFGGYRNGYHRSRELTVGVSAVEVKAPRVRDVPAEVAGGGFESKIVRRYERASRQTQDLFRKLYLEGLSAGDFKPVFRELAGETAALSPNAIVRLKSKWESEYRAWRSGKLDERRYAYVWADGVCLGAEWTGRRLRRYWRWETARRVCGRRWMRCSRLRTTSAAGTIGR